MARPITITTADWVNRAIEKHGTRYDYSQTSYTGSKNYLKIRCPTHGEFEQRASKHLEGAGCKQCTTDTQRKSIDDFIKESQSYHGDYYDYSKTTLRNIHEQVVITCPIHGDFKQTPAKHQRGQGCKKCSGREVWSTEDFLAKAKQLHGNQYDYSDSIYLKSNIPVQIKCLKCFNIFDQTPNSHLNGSGCPHCAGNIKLTDDAFRDLLSETHNGEIIALTEYDGMDNKILVKHTCGNTWETTPLHLINRHQGCRICANEERKLSDEEFNKRLFSRHHGEIIALEPYTQSKQPLRVQHLKCGKIWAVEPRVVLRCGCHNCANRKTDAQFKEELAIVHNNEIVALEPYQTLKTKILVRHTCGNEWLASPGELISKETGCPWCASSKGNKKIATFLSKRAIAFMPEVRFYGCRHKAPLPFDFYLTDYKTLIEYDGEQHFKIVEYWGGQAGLEERQLRDQIKNKWAIENKMELHRIRYDEDIDERLNSILQNLGKI
ncbi:hypothetical protein [Polynucleobacter sp.]|uniref:hypothetical protein n=1 Tax=Polynucleobacter sp. TaxID=2029855 RepID=UPI00262519D6|nr:hypothetical protein [Polynucleobacter sp.]MCW1966417.1 endonuclease domain-containing protein [Polynucleobacter sp.]